MLQIHRKYLFNKINRIVIGVVLCLVFVAYLIAINLKMSFNQRWLNRLDSFSSFYSVIIFVGKFIGVLLASYLMGSSFLSMADGYSVLFIRSPKDKLKYFITKMFVIEGIILLIMLLFCLISNFILAFFARWFTDFSLILKSFLTLSLLSIIYGNISVIFVLLFRTHFSIIIPFVIFLIIEVFSEMPNPEFINFINVLLPTFQISLTGYNIEGYQILHFIILIIFYNLIASTIYYSKDLMF